MSKKYVEDHKSIFDFYGQDISKVIKELQDIQKELPEGQKLTLSTEEDYDGNDKVFLHFERLETDEEYRERIDIEQKSFEKAKDKRYRQYLNLKREFEK